MQPEAVLVILLEAINDRSVTAVLHHVAAVMLYQHTECLAPAHRPGLKCCSSGSADECYEVTLSDTSAGLTDCVAPCAPAGADLNKPDSLVRIGSVLAATAPQTRSDQLSTLQIYSYPTCNPSVVFAPIKQTLHTFFA